MKIIGLININTFKVFRENHITIFEKTYSISWNDNITINNRVIWNKNKIKTGGVYENDINSDRDKIRGNINDKISITNDNIDLILSNIIITKKDISTFDLINHEVYKGKADNIVINGIVGDNGVGKTTLLELLSNIGGQTVSKLKDGYEFIIKKDIGVIYIFKSNTDIRIKKGNLLNVSVSRMFSTDEEYKPHDLIWNKRVVLDKVFEEIIHKDDYKYAIKIKTHNPDLDRNSKVMYLYTYLNKYLDAGVEIVDDEVEEEILFIIDKLNLSEIKRKEYLFLNIVFYFSWLVTSLKSKRIKDYYEYELEFVFEHIADVLDSEVGLPIIRELFPDGYEGHDIEEQIKLLREMIKNINVDNGLNDNTIFIKMADEIGIIYFKRYFQYLGVHFFNNDYEGGKHFYYYKLIGIERKEITNYYALTKTSHNLSFDILFGKGGDNYSFNSLSSGEKTMIKTFISVYDKLLSTKRLNIILIDEPENSLHLRLQMKFIDLLLENSNKFNLNDNFIQFIFTTHSPFMISDIPKDNVIFLERKNNNTRDISIEKDFTLKETFLTNIADTILHGFFLDGKDGIITGELGKKYLSSIRKDYLENVGNKESIRKIEKDMDVIEDEFIKEMIFFLDLD